MGFLQYQKHVPWPSLLVGSVGLLIILSYIFLLSRRQVYLDGPLWLVSLGLLLMLVLAMGLFYTAFWLTESPFTRTEKWRLTIWIFAGLIVTLALTFWPIFHQRIVGVRIADPFFILLISAGLGANAGAVAGISQIRSERKLREAESTRDSLEFLNRLLRHNILNAVQITQGTAERIRDETKKPQISDHASTIIRQSEQISFLVKNTRALIQQEGGDLPVEPVNLTAVISDRLDTARENHPEASIQSDLDDGVAVEANWLLGSVITNLVRNSIEHNNRDAPRITVTLTCGDDSAVIEVGDNGPGISEDHREAVFDPGPHGDYGLGLFLVDRVVSQFDGEVTIQDNEPTGTIVTVELPLASDSNPSTSPQ